jgi:hypothetical protein|uniref:Uncharacterized protein n=1 Tax=uncultured Caudovirales phage TaxID=2100421 RepID=A0A6J5KYM4_9CAUD|nr:hypothetical protein UFOVP88_49 [uncultured Caudovirales phage]
MQFSKNSTFTPRSIPTHFPLDKSILLDKGLRLEERALLALLHLYEYENKDITIELLQETLPMSESELKSILRSLERFGKIFSDGSTNV